MAKSRRSRHLPQKARRRAKRDEEVGMRNSRKRRKPKVEVPDPLGASDIGVLVSPLTREHMYE